MATTLIIRQSIFRSSSLLRPTILGFLASGDRQIQLIESETKSFKVRFLSVSQTGFAKKKHQASLKPQQSSDVRSAPSQRRSAWVDPTEEIFNLEEIKDAMGTAIERLRKDMKVIVNRVGRLTPAYLDSVKVEFGGQRQQLNALAQVIVVDSGTLSVVPYEPSCTKSIEQAIYSSALNLAPKPQSDGSLLISIPKLTIETRQVLAKESGQVCEQARNGIRLVRQSGQKASKADLDSNMITKDDFKDNNKSLDEVTKMHSKSIDEIEAKAKIVLLDK